MIRIQKVLNDLTAERANIAAQNTDAIVEERVRAFREEVRKAVEDEKAAKLAIMDIRIDTAEQILAEFQAAYEPETGTE